MCLHVPLPYTDSVAQVSKQEEGKRAMRYAILVVASNVVLALAVVALIEVLWMYILAPLG